MQTEAGKAPSVKYCVSVSWPASVNPGSFSAAQRESWKRIHSGLVCNQSQIVHAQPATSQPEYIWSENFLNKPHIDECVGKCV